MILILRARNKKPVRNLLAESGAGGGVFDPGHVARDKQQQGVEYAAQQDVQVEHP